MCSEMVSLTLDAAMEREFWQELAPHLSLHDDASPAHATAAAGDLSALPATMRHEGYVNVPGVFAPEVVSGLHRAIESLNSQNIPLAFAFVYDEFWRVFQGASLFIEALLGPGYRALPDFWVWCVPPSEAGAGWGPHRDRTQATLGPKNDPYSLTVWLPFSDATPLNGCMYVLPAHLDERFKSRLWQGDGSTEVADPQSIRALPATAGSLLAWNQCVLHWGGRASHLAAGPRTSAAFEFQRADRAPFNAPLLDPTRTPSFLQRLGLIGKQVLQYQHMYPLSPKMAGVAQALKDRFMTTAAVLTVFPPPGDAVDSVDAAGAAGTAAEAQPVREASPPPVPALLSKATTAGPPPKPPRAGGRQQLTARYVTRFSCIGSDCEDTCCSGWRATVDEPHYVQLKRRMSGSVVEQEQFKDAVIPNTGPDRTAARHAFIRMNDQGYCRLLTADKLCSVQGRYGADALSDVCALYPRAVTDISDRRETFGSLSCPEMSRLALLSEDALDLIESTSEWDPRPPHNRLVDLESTPYGSHLEAVREAMLAVLSQRRFPIGARLFFLAYLGNRTAAHFRRDARKLDESVLANEIDRLNNPDLLQALFDGVASLSVPGHVALALIAEVASARRQGDGFGALVTAVLVGYGVSFADGDRLPGTSSAPTGDITLQQVWERYEQSKSKWEGAFPERCDLYFENYSKNYWLKEPYTASPDLLVHAQKQILRVAVMRFLLFSHPALRTFSGDEPAAVRQDALDRAAVEVISRFSRSVEHTPRFLDALQDALVERGMQDFAHITLFALV